MHMMSHLKDNEWGNTCYEPCTIGTVYATIRESRQPTISELIHIKYTIGEAQVKYRQNKQDKPDADCG